MRTLINIVTQLSEARGLGARTSGEEFVSLTNPDEKIYIQSVKFFPEGGGEFPSHEEAMAAVEEVSAQYPSATVNVVGSFKNNDNAFGVAAFETREGAELVFIKPFKNVKADPTQNSWDNQTGIPGFRYNSKSSAKVKAGMMAQDILKSFSNLQPKDIVFQVAEHFGPEHPLTLITKQIASGQSMPVSIPAPEGLSFTAFRDYFCEILHPIALKTGQYIGEAKGAADRFLGPAGFANTTINFNEDKTEGLSDSSLIDNEGRELRVSSKGSSGADASIKNIWDCLEELSKSNPKLLNKHKEAADLLTIVIESSQEEGPLILGEKFGIITYDDMAVIQGFKGMPLTGLDVVEDVEMSDELRELLLGRNVKNPDQVNLYIHSISAVAHKVAAYINDKTSFSQSAGEILNNSSLVQIYTEASEAGGKWTIKNFNSKWPGSAVKGIQFSAGKNYASTNIKGKFTFRVLRGNDKVIKDEPEDDEVSAAPSRAVKDIEEPGTYGVTGLRPRGAKEPKAKTGITRQRR